MRLATAALGTRIELAIEADGCPDARAAGEVAIDEIEACHRRLSRFAPDSLVSHINRTAAEAPVRLDRETCALFADALAVWRASGGAFDITVAPLMARHGFAPSAVGGAGGGDSGAIVLDEDAWTIRFTRRDLSLDLGAIAKGHALARAAAVLREHGVGSALLHGGTSSVIAIGPPGGHDGWLVTIGSTERSRVVRLRDAALAVSDPRSQRSSAAAAHILDPRTGQPVTRPGRVTVMGPSARLADAWSTALAVLGATPASFPGDFQAIFEHEAPA